MRALAWLLLPLALLALAALLQPGDPPAPEARLSLQEVLGGPAPEGFARALAPQPFRFPADHGPHPDFAAEWWYFTGNLQAADGRHFGYQLTLFRRALSPTPAPRSSSWATSQAWMAHLAITDVAAGTHRSWERFSRQALGLAGAQAQPFRVWLEDWEVSGWPRMRLRAGDLDLELESLHEPVLQGDRGLSQKGREPGNASYYYSLTRLQTAGRLGGVPVSGLSWMDREWSTSALEEGQVGWDWFSLHLSDGSDLMFYQLRQRDGSPSPTSAGILRHPDGRVRRLGVAEVALTPRGSWQGWPVRWSLEIPAEQIALQVEPWLEDQRMDTSVRYWEGAMRIRGTRAGRPISGDGYLELTGYPAGPPPGRTPGG